MITEELILDLQKYGLWIIKREGNYCLVDIETGEWYPETTLDEIYGLINTWNISKEETVGKCF